MIWKQAPRTAADGSVGASWSPDRLLRIDVTHDGVQQTLVMGEHNAARVFALLSIMLELPLTGRVMKEIKL